MFRKPRYTTQDLNDAVKRLSDLENLQELVEKKIRLYTNLPVVDRTDLEQRYQRYSADIKSAQLRLDFMQREGIE